METTLDRLTAVPPAMLVIAAMCTVAIAIAAWSHKRIVAALLAAGVLVLAFLPGSRATARAAWKTGSVGDGVGCVTGALWRPSVLAGRTTPAEATDACVAEAPTPPTKTAPTTPRPPRGS